MAQFLAAPPDIFIGVRINFLFDVIYLYPEKVNKTPISRGIY